MKNIKPKIILLILAVSLIGLLGGCDLIEEAPDKFYKLEPPIILVAETMGGSVVVRDKHNTYLTINEDYYLGNCLANSYNAGDTLK